MFEIHQAHHHNDVPEAVDQPVISQRWKWATVLGNAAIGAAELAAGGMSTLSVTADGVHNAGDAATYYMQAENILNKDLSEERRMRMRKIAHWIIALGSAGIAAKAGLDMAAGHESAGHSAAAYAAGASLALNGALFYRLRKGLQARREAGYTVYEADLIKHFLRVDIPSAALAVAGVALQKYNVHAEQLAAIVSGLLGVHAFRPTVKNLSHHCLGHDHEYQPHDHAKAQEYESHDGPLPPPEEPAGEYMAGCKHPEEPRRRYRIVRNGNHALYELIA